MSARETAELLLQVGRLSVPRLLQAKGIAVGRKSPQCGPCLRETSIRRPQPPDGELDPPVG